MDATTEQRMTRLIFVCSFLISTIVLALLALKQPIKTNIAASYLWGAALVIGTMVISSLTRKRRKLLRLFLLASVLNLILVPPEAYLRFKGFRYESGIQFGYPRPYQFSVFEPHETLFWRFPPSLPGVNSYGFEGPEVKQPKPPGTYRILFVGNSCMYQGYPHMIELILRKHYAGVECINFANPGYTTYQGKVLIKSYIDDLNPDLVVVAYGWNDRWLAYGAVDEEKQIHISSSKAADILRSIYSKWRLLQFFRKALGPVLGRIEPLGTPRVPIDHFMKNLLEIGNECSRRGIPTIFATEPGSHPVLGVPDYITTSEYATSKESSLALFKEYNEAVRKIATEREDWHLIDLDSLISYRNDVREIFTGDGFHFTRSGLALVAEIESRFIAAHILAEEQER